MSSGDSPEKTHLSGPRAKPAANLTLDERYLHTLNRFTFGPTQEDIANIHQLGVEKWFNLQLHPDSLPLTVADQQLKTRLSEFPAMSLEVDELLRRFPSGAETRQAANGKRPLPSDPTLAAIYRRHIALYEQKREEKAEKGVTTTSSESQKIAEKPSAELQAGTPPSKTIAMPEPDAHEVLEPKPEDGLSAAAVKGILALPPKERLDRIFRLSLADYQDLRADLKGPKKIQLTADMKPAERELLSDYDNPTRTVIEELQSQRLLRDIYSSHQLQELMATFWLNHFNVYLHKNEETPYYLVSYERDVIGPRALGKFEDLLIATAESPAMLLYLDNSSSTGPDSPASEKQKVRAQQGKVANHKKASPAGLNENYARELMELHTLGVNGGYSQKDVTEVAKVFTGWTVDRPDQGGSFFFDQSRHEPGDKLVMGRTIRENGQTEGLDLLHRLANSPATAHFISQELAVAFVSDDPPPALVKRMAQAFLRSHGDIASVLSAMFHSPEFWTKAVYEAKVKTPLEYVVSTARASNADVTNTQPLINQLNQMGMPLYACVPPTGYASKADAWVSTGALVARMNFGLSMASNRYPGIQTQWSTRAASVDKSAVGQGLDNEIEVELCERRLELRIVPAGVSEKTRSAVLEQMEKSAQNQPPVTPIAMQPAKVMVMKKPNESISPASPAAQAGSTEEQGKQEKQDAQLAGLLLGSPEFERR